MPKFTAEDTKKREDWTKALFMKNPGMSQPEAYKAIRKEFKSGMRPMRIYELRDEVLKDMGIKKDRRGNPIIEAKPANGTYSEQANRIEGETAHAPVVTIPEPLAGRCILPVVDVSDAVGFQQKLNIMNQSGFLTPKVKVEAATDSYIILAHEK